MTQGEKSGQPTLLSWRWYQHTSSPGENHTELYKPSWEQSNVACSLFECWLGGAGSLGAGSLGAGQVMFKLGYEWWSACFGEQGLVDAS